MVLVSLHASDQADGDADTGQPQPDIVVRAALRSALHSVQTVCDELLEGLALARRRSLDAEAVAAERIATIQAEAESTVQRVRLGTAVEISELRCEIDRLRQEMKRHEAMSGDTGGICGGDQQARSEDATENSVPDLSRQIEALRSALALSRSDLDDVSRRLHEEKQKHVRLIDAVRSLATKNRALTSVPAAPELNIEAQAAHFV